MKNIQEHLQEVDRAMAAEDGATHRGGEWPSWLSSLVVWLTAGTVAAVILWSFVS
jgi:hypothetical protein